MKAELLPSDGSSPIPITRDITLIGRREYCDVQLDHPSLSKRHCVLVMTDGLLMLRDLASTNGTKVNGQRVMWAALLPNDRIKLGRCKFKVYLGPDNAPSPSEEARWKRPSPRPETPPRVPDELAPRLQPMEFAPPSLESSVPTTRIANGTAVDPDPEDVEDLGEFMIDDELEDENFVIDLE